MMGARHSASAGGHRSADRPDAPKGHHRSCPCDEDETESALLPGVGLYGTLLGSSRQIRAVNESSRLEISC